MLALHTSAFLRISYQPLAQIVEVHWSGPCEPARLHHAYGTRADVVDELAVHRILLDVRERGRITAVDARWVATTAYADLLETRTSPLRIAYVVPEEVFATFPQGQNQTAGDLLHIAAFLATPEAAVWLLDG